MTEDWARLGHLLAASRKEAGLSQADISARLKVSRATVQNIERGSRGGMPFTRINSTMLAYAHLMKWDTNSVEAVLEGGEPLLMDRKEEPARGLPVRVLDELNDAGLLLDTDVIQLPGGGRVIVVVKAKPEVTPSEAGEAIDAWRDLQRKLR